MNEENPIQIEIAVNSQPGEPCGKDVFVDEFERPQPRRATGTLAIVLFLLTVLSTLVVGTEFALAYANQRAPFSEGFGFYVDIWRDPSLLLRGIPFSFTLLTILLAHELGHFFACRYYGMVASYPYFIPAPTIIGTMGAFIRIRSPIVNRRALFDVGLAGPVVGFIFALPALALAIRYSVIVPAAHLDGPIVFGQPLLARVLAMILRPDIPLQDIFLHPVGRAAWVGLFATAMNLLPAGQLDGGHIVYALASKHHRMITRVVTISLLVMGGPTLLAKPLGIKLVWFWEGWLVLGVLLLFFGSRHPMLLDRWERLDQKRRIWAAIALAIFALCFMPIPLKQL